MLRVVMTVLFMSCAFHSQQQLLLLHTARCRSRNSSCAAKDFRRQDKPVVAYFVTHSERQLLQWAFLTSLCGCSCHVKQWRFRAMAYTFNKFFCWIIFYNLNKINGLVKNKMLVFNPNDGSIPNMHHSYRRRNRRTCPTWVLNKCAICDEFYVIFPLKVTVTNCLNR